MQISFSPNCIPIYNLYKINVASGCCDRMRLSRAGEPSVKTSDRPRARLCPPCNRPVSLFVRKRLIFRLSNTAAILTVSSKAVGHGPQREGERERKT